MTETSPVSFQTRADASLEQRTETVGAIHPYVEAKVVDTEGRMVPIGEKGELLIRGYLVMRGYWNDPERTADAIDTGGWMHTGDLAILRPDGHARIVGRVKDMIIRGGENIYPAEVEDFLYRHPHIKAVAVFGVPDRKFGEAVACWVQLREETTLSEDEVRAFCDGRIAHYKVPKHIRFVDEFPMTVTGKIQKFEMRIAMSAELGLAEIETA